MKICEYIGFRSCDAPATHLVFIPNSPRYGENRYMPICDTCLPAAIEWWGKIELKYEL